MEKEKIKDLDKKIEAVLFAKAEPFSKKDLAKILECEVPEIESAINTLEGKLSDRGIILMRKEEEIMLGTSPKMSALIEKVRKEELSRDIGRAGLETLSIVLYKGPISRKEIDYVRGVNSGFILRHLTERGLVERVNSEKDERVFLYKPTLELLAYLGIKRVEDLPEFSQTKKEIEEIEKREISTETEEKKHAENPIL